MENLDLIIFTSILVILFILFGIATYLQFFPPPTGYASHSFNLQLVFVPNTDPSLTGSYQIKYQEWGVLSGQVIGTLLTPGFRYENQYFNTNNGLKSIFPLSSGCTI